MHETPGLIVIGAGGHARSVVHAAVFAGFRVLGLVDESRMVRDSSASPPVWTSVAEARQEATVAGETESPWIVIAVGDNRVREDIARRLERNVTDEQQLHATRFATVVHPRAWVDPTARVGEGSVVLTGAVIGAGAVVGRHCIVNTVASLDHDSRLADFASMAPRSVTGGNVDIGARSAVCLGACIRQGISVARDVVVGAASYVNESISEPETVHYGVPARRVRTRSQGEPYL